MRSYQFVWLMGMYLMGMGCSTHQPSFAQPSPRILGADISFLPQLEDEGVHFQVDGQTEDAITILHQHGFNFIRLRIFVHPEADSGYSPGKGYCDLSHTLAMARRIKAAGMGFLLDFHYSDTWADPSKQYIPEAWKNLSLSLLEDSLYAYTRMVLLALKNQGTLPDIVQTGNEINHGILWPVGNIEHTDTLAELLKTAIAAVKSVDPHILVMLHIADGGQNAESCWFLDAMLQRQVSFDLIGQSYYPQWHGTLTDLQNNLTDLAGRYSQPIIVVEYTYHKKEVNDIVFHLPHQKGWGSFIWEPLNTWEAIFDRQGVANDSLLHIYDSLSAQYQIPRNDPLQ
ncbi:glycoside hydrolase family 53 protein [Thermoflavifilum thermophilum]|uniref:Arabinogalactan endo-beta-1,4-galactanase n=1 Tax=Thermoflavifilum thermophilum TaxID=1393122 RepID=A0A1I7NC65_9BACT|nr:glycosyl hydrolase 53 family protein [Thermoflavifilum thermophilum]SFV32231.1 arabinogalactan endo-1,4-beta-galactosidase [Thermoflavifilum thermophilum]